MARTTVSQNGGDHREVSSRDEALRIASEAPPGSTTEIKMGSEKK
jgi:hypothetical protein